MGPFTNYYRILDISENAGIEEIKSAFRRLAMIVHPDKNHGSTAKFILIYQAYSTLCDPEKRKDYDCYLKTSATVKNWKNSSYSQGKKAAGFLPGVKSSPGIIIETIYTHLNYILWDIEDFLRNSNNIDKVKLNQRPQQFPVILKILVFIDKWVLTLTGFPDYFLEARRMGKDKTAEYFQIISEKLRGNDNSWGIYTDIRDYFYNIRKRMDRLISHIKMSDLLNTVPESGIRIIDCVFEAQSYAVHWIRYLNQAQDDESEKVEDFQHSNPIFYK